ncbi:MAG: 6-phosphofructokinase [Provencibacterium sp.]|nr:6-phosphofructokinase [Provencibacterium sp.]
MENRKKKIGVLTSGGDAPGMNAAIRAVVRSSIAKGLDVVGVRHGYNGLISGDIFDMNLRSVSEILHRGGTILYTARCKEFRTHEGVLKAKETCEKLGIDGLVVIGGDGSFRGARDLSLEGIPCVGLPGTIDNDISCSDYCIGFDTALNTAVEAVDRLRDTSQSHDRCNVVEIMGNGAGHLSLECGIACGASAIWVNEVDFDVDASIIQRILETGKTGKHHFIVIVGEGITDVHSLAKYIQERTGVESRATVLGHIQRGGSPTAKDRIMATQLGFHAVELLEKGIGNRVVVIRRNRVVDFDILEALQMKKEIDHRLYDIAKMINI